MNTVNLFITSLITTAKFLIMSFRYAHRQNGCIILNMYSYSLQQQIQFNVKIFGNKKRCCKECPLYYCLLQNYSTRTIITTLKCLSIGTPKAINFPFVSNEKLMFFRCPSIQAHCNEAVIYLNFGTPKNNEFSIWNKWKIYYF